MAKLSIGNQYEEDRNQTQLHQYLSATIAVQAGSQADVQEAVQEIVTGLALMAAREQQETNSSIRRKGNYSSLSLRQQIQTMKAL